MSEQLKQGFNKQGKVIICLLIALILLVCVALWAFLSQDKTDSAANTSAQGSASTTNLADVDMDSIHEQPAPSAPESWGDYVLDKKWNGEVRVFDTEKEPTSLLDEAGEEWLGTANRCGSTTYLLTFKAVNEKAVLGAQLVDPLDSTQADGTMRSGWMLFTNCSTPKLSLHEIDGDSTLTDVAYDVYEYRQSSTESKN